MKASIIYPLTVYGSGGHIRGYLNIKDTFQRVHGLEKIPANKGQLKIYDQILETFSVNELVALTKKVTESPSLNVEIKSISNPRKGAKGPHYNPAYQGLRELGVDPHLF